MLQNKKKVDHYRPWKLQKKYARYNKILFLCKKKKSRMRSERKRSKELEDWKQYRARKCVYAR